MSENDRGQRQALSKVSNCLKKSSFQRSQKKLEHCHPYSLTLTSLYFAKEKSYACPNCPYQFIFKFVITSAAKLTGRSLTHLIT